MTEHELKSCGKYHAWCQICQPDNKTVGHVPWNKDVAKIKPTILTNWQRLELKDIVKAESNRTRRKIINRAGLVCAMCGWDEASCDLAHAIPHCEGGTYEPNNLVVLCPNHHRMADTGILGIRWWVGFTIQDLLGCDG